MKVLDAEKNVGIETFFTSSAGSGGKLRSSPNEFIVEEISNYPEEKKNGRFVIAEVTVTNWETNILIRELSERLHVSRKRIGFAGTKDKRAKTTQLMSFYNVKTENVSKIKLKDVEIKNVYGADRPVKIGNLFGNKFEIVVRGIDPNLNEIKKTASKITSAGGFPNFYGIQRFGIIRPITHIVGKNIVKGDFEKAVMTYIANPIKGEDEESYNLRKNLEKTKDFSEALKSYPRHLNFEKAILNKLVNTPDDFVTALKELPNNLLTMFVYAYQSHLFNKILSERIRKDISINNAIVGDIILPIRKGIICNEEISAKESNIEKINKQISKGKAVVSAVLFGSDSNFSSGEMGEIEQSIIEKENIDPRDFIIPEIPFISSMGSRRAIIAPVRNLNFELISDETDEKNPALKLNFELRKGCYATSLLREFMKTDDIRNY